MYFFDFDRVLFDTDAYNASLPDEPGCAPFADVLRDVLAAGRDQTLTGSTERVRAWELVSDAIKSGALTFAPGALARFMYPDALQALRTLENNAVVITYGEIDRQRVKIESALAGIPRVTVLYTGEVDKATYLSTWPGYFGTEAVLVDDRAAELESLAKAHPALRLFEMRRDGGAGDGRWPVIHSLSELP